MHFKGIFHWIFSLELEEFRWASQGSCFFPFSQIILYKSQLISVGLNTVRRWFQRSWFYAYKAMAMNFLCTNGWYRLLPQILWKDWSWSDPFLPVSFTVVLPFSHSYLLPGKNPFCRIMESLMLEETSSISRPTINPKPP